MFWEILKASKGLPVIDQYAALWGKKIAEADGWKVTEITGELPITFLSDGSVLVDYRIYGTSAGAGVETENLFSAKLEQGTLGSTGEALDSDLRVRTSNFIILPSNSTLILSSIGVSSQAIIFVYDLNGTYSRTLIREWSTLPITFTISANEKIKIVFRNSNNTSITPESLPTVMITEGSTPPDHYIPHGYKLPLTVENGAQSQDIPIYIGDTKLYEDEYVDYGEQKIYRTILLTTHDNKDFITSDNKRFCVRRSNNA